MAGGILTLLTWGISEDFILAIVKNCDVNYLSRYDLPVAEGDL
jgi:hypothetical protein